jgi:hypothetical protein
MKDLSDMLEKENIGVSFSSKTINALMYADDVALIAESESDLRKMLNISHDLRKIIFAALYCILCSKLRCASDDESHMEQPCAIHGRITEVHKAFPINAFLDRQRISYFSRFSELNSTRLCKQTFDELFSKNIKEWPYFDYIRSLFESVGLDHFINGSFNKGTFYTFLGEFTK